VETVMGLPSSGIEYDVLSVRREMSVARSVPVALSPVVSMMDSVGAGRIGLRVLTPMMVRRPSTQSHAPWCSTEGRMRGVLFGGMAVAPRFLARWGRTVGTQEILRIILIGGESVPAQTTEQWGRRMWN
jgi:hypothetical protein